MNDLRDLYQEVILEHARKPRNHRALVGDTCRHAAGHNPLCGDKVTVHADVQGGVVRDVAFEGSGCAISTASASVMTETVKGRTTAEAEELFRRFRDLVTGQGSGLAAAQDLGKLSVFAGVSEFPARVKCASLAWHVLHAALAYEHETVTTE